MRVFLEFVALDDVAFLVFVELAEADAAFEVGADFLHLVLEAADGIGTGTSSRNSEVIHAGLYYATGSLKARLCVEGRRKLYAYCAAHGVEAHRCGKLVVAVDDGEAAATPALLKRALENGVEDIRLIDGAEARRLEPALSPEVRVAIHSEASGLFDSHAYFLALQGEFEDRGGSLVLNSPVVRGEVVKDGIAIETGGESPVRVIARTVVNAAGHNALPMARSWAGVRPWICAVLSDWICAPLIASTAADVIAAICVSPRAERLLAEIDCTCVSVIAAIYTNQFATPREQELIKPTIEFIQAIPSVVLGFIGISVLGDLIKDITLHIAALNPRGLAREDIAEELIEAEKSIFRAQLLEEGKPEAMLENILVGKMKRFYAENCLLEQGFVKDPSVTVKSLLEAKGKELGDTLTLRRYVRFGLGE